MPLASDRPPAAVVRAKALRMAHKPALEARAAERLSRERLMAQVLDFTMQNFRHADGRIGVSNVEMARWCDVGEVIVRGWKSREKPVPSYHLMKLPADFRAALIDAWTVLFCGPVANDVDLP